MHFGAHAVPTGSTKYKTVPAATIRAAASRDKYFLRVPFVPGMGYGGYNVTIPNANIIAYIMQPTRLSAALAMLHEAAFFDALVAPI